MWAGNSTPAAEPRAPPSNGLFDAAERAVMAGFWPALGSCLLFHQTEKGKKKHPGRRQLQWGFNLFWPWLGGENLNRCESALFRCPFQKEEEFHLSHHPDKSVQGFEHTESNWQPLQHGGGGGGEGRIITPCLI